MRLSSQLLFYFIYNNNGYYFSIIAFFPLLQPLIKRILNCIYFAIYLLEFTSTLNSLSNHVLQ